MHLPLLHVRQELESNHLNPANECSELPSVPNSKISSNLATYLCGRFTIAEVLATLRHTRNSSFSSSVCSRRYQLKPERAATVQAMENFAADDPFTFPVNTSFLRTQFAIHSVLKHIHSIPKSYSANGIEIGVDSYLQDFSKTSVTFIFAFRCWSLATTRILTLDFSRATTIA